MNRPSVHYMPQLDSLRAIAVFAVSLVLTLVAALRLFGVF